MTTSQAGGPGVLDTPGIPAYPDSMDILSDPKNIPQNVAGLPGDTVIGLHVWAALQGVEPGTVYRNRTLAAARRAAQVTYDAAMAEFDAARAARAADPSLPEPVPPAVPKPGLPKAGDMPAEDGTVGNSPVWTLGTYRAWEASRPGKGAGAGRPRLAQPPPRRTVRLPVTCPSCGHRITARELAEASTEASTGTAAA